MGLDLVYIDGQTPLDEEEKEGLLISTIATRAELDEFEQQNIEEAIKWTLVRKFKPDNLFTENFVKDVHKRMYKDVWSWAGNFRKTNKNIGVDRWKVAVELKNLLEDIRFWVDNNTFAADEIAIRFKHRVVSIHCFSNGNGRHSRLMADIIIEKIFDKPVFTWGAGNLSKESEHRKKYLDALKLADVGSYEALILFARS
ncbi:mobile mystery protein B [Pedobacter sp. ISL-68]|uniref:mobile mystery protein B n=1 Tax=unclassified Pedobacter TaxID=2628915 RepID=UPI001BE62082|nr:MULTISPECIES: mobile mystery protein B [unclassified Pedobacter]MBT2562951.1 mobile mystery protein B [Pedobacter sp. ISL-64]MBT2593492.1 mobile mystery protein B [Pedobacter sp. ISL-68]